jgi:4-amino-4-deoxy-L-arabinose transferase-like glycosyltransferase
MSNTKKCVLLFGILIIATFFRFYHFATTPPGLYPDEAIDGNNAAEAARTGQLKVFYTEDNGREGLYVNIIAVILEKFPVYEPWIIRFPAAVAGVLTVLGIYFLVAELFRESDIGQAAREKLKSDSDGKTLNQKTQFPVFHFSPFRTEVSGPAIALLAAFFLATSFWHINFSRIGFRAILAPLLLVWSAYFLIKALKAVSTHRATIYAILAGIVYGLGFYTYIAYRITPLLFLLLIPFFGKGKDFWKRVAVFVILVFVTAAPIGEYFLAHPADFFGRTAEISVTNATSPARDFAVNIVKTALMFNFHGDNNWRQNISGSPELFWPVGILFIIGIMLGLYSLWKSWRKKIMRDYSSNVLPLFPLLFVFLWIILAALPAAASNEGIPHSLRSILMLPPAMILAAIGGVWLYQIMKNQWGKNFARIAGFIFILTVGIFGYVDYFIVWAQNPNVQGAFNANYVTIGNEINALPASTPKYVVINAGGVITRGFPMPAETTMFITDSFLPDQAAEKNIHYLLPNEASTIPAGTPQNEIFYIN